MSGPPGSTWPTTGPAATQAAPAPAWRSSLVALFALLVLTLALYWRTAAEMAGIWWRSDTYAHAMLVPPLVLWLVWRQRVALQHLVPRPTAWAVLPLGLAALLWWLGTLLQSNVVTQFALVSLLVLQVVAVLGWGVARVLWFPLLFAYFAVPAGEALVPVLMEGTADVTVAALRVSGIPVFREGLNFVIPSGQWSVVEACSGVRYLIASFMVGTLFAYLNFQGTTKRLVFMGVSLLVPIVANWMRAYLIVLLGHVSGNQLAVGADHLVYGWVFFGIVMMVTYLIGARWADPEPAAPAAVALPSATALPASPWRGAVVLAAALALAWPVAVDWLRQQAQPSALALNLPPTLPGGWQQAALPSEQWAPIHLRPSLHLGARYVAPGQAVDVDIAYYRQQDRERKLVSATNVLLKQGDTSWNALPLGTQVVTVSGQPVAWRATRLVSRQGDRPDRLVWQTLWVDGRFTVSDLQARLNLVRAILSGRGDDAAGLTLSTDINDMASAQQHLQGLVQAGLPALQAALDANRRGRP